MSLAALAAPKFRLRLPPRGGLAFAYVGAPLLLAVSGYGLWLWLSVLSGLRIPGYYQLFLVLSMVIVPLVCLVFLMVRAAQRMEYNRLSAGYHIRIDQLQRRINEQEDLMRMIVDRDPQAISIFDDKNRYWFVNSSAAQELGVEVRDIIGRHLSKILGYDRAHRLEARLREVRASSRKLEMLDERRDPEGHVRFVQSHMEPLIPLGELKEGVLLRSEDVTGLLVERERRETTLRQVIATLVAVVDRRDPYAAGHSARVGRLARAVAEEMVLSEKEIETAEIAGSLMNFGKVLVPREILTKTGALSAEELQRVRDSILTSADILSIIEFTGPVVPVLRQVMERFDGTGVPHGVKGEDILMPARVVAVANAYVALVSSRAHRPSLSSGEAVEQLMSGADKAYDRRVIVALGNCLENRAGRLDWLHGGPSVQPDGNGPI